LLGEGLVAEAPDLSGVEGSDRLAGKILFGDAIQEDLRVGDARDERVHRGGTQDGVALPLIEES